MSNDLDEMYIDGYFAHQTRIFELISLLPNILIETDWSK